MPPESGTAGAGMPSDALQPPQKADIDRQEMTLHSLLTDHHDPESLLPYALSASNLSSTAMKCLHFNVHTIITANVMMSGMRITLHTTEKLHAHNAGVP